MKSDKIRQNNKQRERDRKKRDQNSNNSSHQTPQARQEQISISKISTGTIKLPQGGMTVLYKPDK